MAAQPDFAVLIDTLAVNDPNVQLIVDQLLMGKGEVTVDGGVVCEKEFVVDPDKMALVGKVISELVSGVNGVRGVIGGFAGRF